MNISKVGTFTLIALCVLSTFVASCSSVPTVTLAPSGIKETTQASGITTTVSTMMPSTTVAAKAVTTDTVVPATQPVATPTLVSVRSTPTATSTNSGEVRTLTVMTHDSFMASDEVIKAFETANNIKLNILKSGDAGAALNKAILAKGNPLADVFYGVDNTFVSRALEAGIFEPYLVNGLSVPTEFAGDIASPPQVTAIDYGDVCINYDKAYFEQKKLKLPQTLGDLLKPDYSNLLVVENPATSSPGLAFMLATVSRFGSDKFIDYWKQLKSNGMKVVDGWDTAYNTEFSGSAGKGSYPLVVSYASSPPAEVLFAKTPLNESPIGSLLGEDMCFRQIEYAGVLKGAKNRDLAEKFMDFLSSKAFQNDMPLQMFVFPVNPRASLPDAFIKYAQIPEKPARIAADEIAKNRDAWIQSWTEAVTQ